tara:strand:- start:7 stop:264 length:258 start_codon:yes stop_codon:yes gene_type:complete
MAYWMNHPTRIAERHYLQVTDHHYRRATSREVSNGKQTFAPETSLVGAQMGAKTSLSQVVAMLIERWDELTGDEKAEMANLVKHW